MKEKVKAWFEATNDLCWSGCIARSTWEECDFLHDEITEMWEAAQPKWLPIASAPKDTPILGCAEFTDEGWTTVTVEWSHGVDYDGYWNLVVCGKHAEDGEWNPTHWQPLPAPPKKESE